MEKFQKLVEHPGRRRPNFGLRPLISVLQYRFGEFEIPVAELVPGELVADLCCVVKAIALQRL